jgi:DNA-binding CsgD family transcriptional regulator
MATKTHAPECTIHGKYEFYEDNGEVKFLNKSGEHLFEELPISILDILRADLDAHPKARVAMENRLGITNPLFQLKQWAVCNFGNFDNKADLTDDGIIIHEHVNCPQRGTCKFEGIICLPLLVENGTLTPREIQVIKLIAKDLLDKQIADMLGMALNTMSVHRTKIEKKIGCHSKAGITAYAYQNNLI